MFLKNRTKGYIGNCSVQIERLKQALETADAVLIGAGAGLSTSAGLTYSGERFERYFSDFHQKYRITDMYSGGFYPYDTLEEYWAWWSRHIFYNRYVDAPLPVYQELLALVKDKDYFVLTTNVDHQFQRAGFDKKRLTTYRRYDVGFVFQFYNLVQNLTARENVELAAEICRDPLDADTVLDEVGLADRKNNFPAQLSGGEQQRVSIARALAKNPKILLCDEPTGALDYKTGKQVLALLQATCRKQGRTVIVITHNSALAAMADRVIRINSGRVVDQTVNPNPTPVERIEW